MFARIGKKKFSLYAFDIETHNDEESIKKMETSMWLGCLLNDESTKEDESSYLYNMNEFLDRIEILSSGKRRHGESRPLKNIAIYVYNLSFEWSFILPKLLERGFKFKEFISDKDEYVYNSVTTKSVSSVWSIELKFSEKHGKVIFRDLAKIYGGGLNKVAKAFELETQKGEIDYRKNRLHDYQVTQEEKEYCFNDTYIIVEILKKVIDAKDKTFFQSMSMASYSMKMLMKFGWPKSMFPYKEYRKMYPNLEKEETEFLRHSVSGGLTYATRRYQFKDIKQEIVHIDAHSMHPSSAYLKYYPYGFGEYHKGKPIDTATKINCCHIKISYMNAKLHSIIKLKDTNMIENCELWVWDFEIPTMLKCYEELEIEYIDYYAYNYKRLPWRKFYEFYFNGRIEAKEKGDLYNYLRYKLIINSSYGKSLENAHLSMFKNIVGEDGIIDSEELPKEKPDNMKQELWDIKMLNARYTYLPYGSCIPAYSRVALIELALKIGWKDIVYFDTDSIFFIKNKRTMGNLKKYCNLKNELGGWAIEEILTRAQFTAPKRYKTENDKGVTIKAGGINFTQYLNEKGKAIGITDPERLKEFREHYEFNYEEINIESSKWQVQRAYRCKGGTIIDFQEKEMSIPDKYIDIYKKNVK